MKSKFIIAAATSGSGKTTLTLGLLRCLRDMGISVAPFKCGPDYIDTQWHRCACNKVSTNLDTFMSSEKHVKSIFEINGRDSDVCVVEGVMGMYDGYDNMRGSSADIARLLDIPVVLLVNAKSTAYSAAALIYGFKNFNPEVDVAGVIFNNVASSRHFSCLSEACADAGVKCLGYISRLKNIEVPSRHLGLSLESDEVMEQYICRIADAVRDTVDINALLSETASVEDTSVHISDVPNIAYGTNARVAVACDEAFNFIYQENINTLWRSGAEIVYFSPIRDISVPDAELLYIPGGYPELYSARLEKNRLMRESIKDFAESNGKILAECGGLLYLSKDIDSVSMCGILPFSSTMSGAKLTLGYRAVDFGVFGIRGHEFHYSKLLNADALPGIAQQYDIKGNPVSTRVYRYKNVIAGYTHLYFGETDIMKLWQN